MVKITLYLLCLLWVGISCNNCDEVTISNALPIQFWDVDDETFNEKEVCSINNACFCLPVNCDQEIPFLFVIPITNTWNDWTIRASAADNNWNAVAYGNGLFVAVASSGTGNRVMTSPDGITWTIRTSAADNDWFSVAYGNGLFVAVSITGSGNRVMTSPDGITWTSRTSAADNNWYAVTYGNNLFVAVAYSGTGNRVMTSPDGITWTSRTSAADNTWNDVTYGNGLFVAVASSGTGNRVMTSPDGITWTSRASAADNDWISISYGNGLFVAVATTGSGNRVMTSPDGVNWTIRASAANNTWTDVTYGNGLFVAVSNTGSGNRSMTSPDGITWTIRTTPANNTWFDVTYGNGLFVAVGYSGSGNRVMTSGRKEYYLKIYENGNLIETEDFIQEEIDTDFIYSLNIIPNDYSLCDRKVSFEIWADTEAIKKSDCIDLKESHDCTTLITYTNSKTFAGIDYTDQSPNPEFSIRIPAIFFEEAFPDEHEEIDLSDSQSVRLMNKEKRQKKLDIGFMPFYMHQKLKLILAHDEITIDGDSWIRTEAYEIIDGNKRYPLRKASVLLTDKNYIVRNVL